MKTHLYIILSICFYNLSFCQKNGVTILEETTPKRIFLYAENITNITKNVFLKVDATGFRRRTDRPLIEVIPPKSKKLLITLIPLTGIESKYTYTYIVNNETENIRANVLKVKKDSAKTH